MAALHLLKLPHKNVSSEIERRPEENKACSIASRTVAPSSGHPACGTASFASSSTPRYGQMPSDGRLSLNVSLESTGVVAKKWVDILEIFRTFDIKCVPPALHHIVLDDDHIIHNGNSFTIHSRQPSLKGFIPSPAS
jgi:hypothetical protein